jgi:hypothetical protein
MDAQPGWDWSSVQDGLNDAARPTAGRSEEGVKQDEQSSPRQEQPSQEAPQSGARARRQYGPRSCRICLDTEYPKFPTDTPTTFGVAEASSRPTYQSDDPELGRLLSPCKCKGSQKYVHEGCLNAWRLANPTAARNYWQCPTCKFNYRMSRLHWASMLSSKWTQVALTIFTLIISLFILGFIADPLFDLWFDPFGVLTDTVAGVLNDIEAREEPMHHEPPSTWSEHFAKGFFSLGLVGFFKTMFAMTPWQWFYFRGGGGMGGGRRAGTGRARAENMSWLLIVIGAVTFLMAIWRFVKAMSARVLKNVSDRVIDVNEDDDDDDDESKKDQ